MTDIVERLELQAFVADKIQSGMKPLIMDCLEEITHLRCQYEALLNQAEMNARLLTENASLRGEVEMLRRDVKTAVMGDSAELQDVKRENEKLREALSALAKHCNNMEAQNHDYHTMGEGGAPCISEPLANAYAIMKESGDE